MIRARLLVVDDEPTLCDTLKFNLELEGFAVDTAYSAEEAITLPLADYSLILLDVMMGEISGFKLAKIIKESPKLAHIPIIFCTAKDSEDDMVSGLQLGGDDYITKSYSIRNVIARVNAVLRRTAGAAQLADSGSVLSCGGLSVDSVQKKCIVDGMEVRLPRKEFEVLSLLLANPGKIFSRGEILGRIWPEDVVVLERVVDVNVTRLRSKIGKYGRFIVSRSGYGYVFDPKD